MAGFCSPEQQGVQNAALAVQAQAGSKIKGISQAREIHVMPPRLPRLQKMMPRNCTSVAMNVNRPTPAPQSALRAMPASRERGDYRPAFALGQPMDDHSDEQGPGKSRQRNHSRELEGPNDG